MTAPRLPVILHIDDEPDELRTWADQVTTEGRGALSVLHPKDVTSQELDAASLVLVDYKLEHFPLRDELKCISLKPRNGIALLAVLQESISSTADKPRAFALYTAALHELAKGLIPQPHIVARAHNLEWIFEKSEGFENRRTRVVDLALAVQRLPTPWPAEKTAAEQALRAWLGMGGAEAWGDAAWQSILRCRPPLHDFAVSTHGIGVLRWMLHRILPYPTFLYDDVHLAARLRVDIRSLRECADSHADFISLMSSARYDGSLSKFMGRRWWRSAIESVIFALAPEDPANLELLHKKLKELAPSLVPLMQPTVFPVLGPNYSHQDVLASPVDVVEAVPDDWPPYADLAWVLRADLEDHPELATIATLDQVE